MFAIQLTAPSGTKHYWPKGFGFTAHKLTRNKNKAEKFIDKAKAERMLNGYLHPKAFWPSEIHHAQLIEREMRGWNCKVIPANAEE